MLIESGALVVGDGYRAKRGELSSIGLPFARAGNINGGFRFDDADCFSEENVGRVGTKISQPGDAVFTSKGTLRRFAIVRSGTPRFVYSPQLCFWRSLDPNVIDPRFLFFWMFGREFFVQFKGLAGQTDMADYVSLSDQRRMHITLPPSPEQRAMAHILGVLDDKIELNRRPGARHATGQRARRGAGALRGGDGVLRRAGDERQRRQGAGRRDATHDRTQTRRDGARHVKLDWTMRENVRAYLRVLVKRILRKHGYPSDKQEKATQTVLEQAAVLSDQWASLA